MRSVSGQVSCGALLLLTVLGSVRCMKPDEIARLKKELLDPKVYDKTVRPHEGEKPVGVKVNMYVRKIWDIKDTDMTFDLDVTFRSTWTDPRLAYRNNTNLQYLTFSDEDAKLWRPDLFFPNEIHAERHNVLVSNVLVRVFPNGDVLRSERILLKLSCPMNLSPFPNDEQTCSIRIASYGFTTNDMLLFWKESDPVQVSKSLHIPLFILDNMVTDYCTSKTLTGEYGCLTVGLHFKREKGYYTLHLDIPILMLMIVGYFAMWLPLHPHGTTRTAILFGCLVVMAVGVTNFNQTMANHRVSYTRCVDYYTGFSLTVLFIMLAETMICLASGYGKANNEDIANAVDKDIRQRNFTQKIRTHYSENKGTADFWIRIFALLFIVVLVAVFF